MRSGLYYADIDRVDGGDVWVTVLIPGGGHQGPFRCQFLEGPGVLTGPASGGVGHTHLSMASGALAGGQRVVVGFMWGDPDRPVILGRLA